jgi:hypothetical protein
VGQYADSALPERTEELRTFAVCETNDGRSEVTGHVGTGIQSTVEWITDIDPVRRRAVADALIALRSRRAMLYEESA